MKEFKLYKFNDVKDITAEEYFSDNSLAVDVFNAKYAFTKDDGNKETPAEVFYRVSTGLAKFEGEKDQEYYIDWWFSLMWDGWFRPGGSIITGVGNPKPVSLINCTSIPVNDDSLEGIIRDAEYEMAKCAAMRQGLGAELCALRPKGAPINNAAEVSDGVVSWATKFSELGRFVGQRGRYPALLLSLSIDHPDVEEFIVSKTDLKAIVNANISVQITDKFMEALKNDEEWELKFEFDNGKYEPIIKTVRAKDLFELIAKTAFNTAEPGLQYIDLMRKGSMIHKVYEYTNDDTYRIYSTNACQPGYAEVLTPKGIRTLDSISVGDAIWSGKEWTTIQDKWCTGIKTVYRYETNAGEFIGTSDHRIVQRGKKQHVKQADAIDVSIGPDTVSTIIPEAVMDGLITGDGSVHKASNNLIYLCIGSKDKDYFESEVKDLITKDRTDAFKCGWEVKTSLTYKDVSKTYDRMIPVKYYNGNYNVVCSFLRGLFSANGYVVDGRVCLKQSSYKLVRQVQKMLSFVGIASYITKNKAKKVVFSNGTYTIKKSYDINITSGKVAFFNNIGFIQKYKQDRLRKYVDAYNESYPYKSTFDIFNIEELGEEQVYDITVASDDHTYWTGGCLVSNCSEKPLPKYGCCNLLSINVEKFSTDPVEYKKELSVIIPFLVHLSDNVVEYECTGCRAPLEAQAQLLRKTREIGLGFTNMHGWLLKQDLAYDSDEAATAAEEFFSYYAYQTFQSSVNLGDEKGSAPAWLLVDNKEVFMNSTYFKNIVDKYYDGDYTKVRTMRNMAHMSVAPSGSISLILPDAVLSTGVEPLFAPTYWKKTRAVKKGVYTHYFTIPEKVKQYVLSKLESNSDDYNLLNEFTGSVEDNDGTKGNELKAIIDKAVPKGFFKAAHEIDPLQKIKMMGKLYKWVDAAISCTYNLPRSATYEDVYNIYLQAYEAGVRAVSVYVDGSREGILLTEDPVTYAKKYEKKLEGICEKRPVSIVPNCAPKRPKELECDIHHTSVKGDIFLVMVGKMDNHPFELFAGPSDDLYLPKSCNSGIIVKEGGGKYSLHVTIRRAPVVYQDLASVLMSDDQKALTRMLSLSLRHGAPPRYLVDQLKKSNGNITAFSTAVARVLSRYIGTYNITGDESKCPSCGENSLIFTEGCIKCVNDGCNYSKCG